MVIKGFEVGVIFEEVSVVVGVGIILGLTYLFFFLLLLFRHRINLIL